MDELKKDFLFYAYEFYEQYVEKYASSVHVSSYLIRPLSYIEFAREETYLFKLLFIKDMDLKMTEEKDFYNHYDEENRLLLRHGSVEFLTTMHYIAKYIKPGDHVLEIGAGTGRYSHALARRGYSVDAVELVPHMLCPMGM